MAYTFKQLYILLFSCLISGTVAAQEVMGAIQGVVVDSLGKPCPYLSITIRQNNQSTTTTESGEFEFAQLPSATYVLVISRLGNEVFQKEVIVQPGKTSFVQWQVNPGLKNLQEVLITGYRKTNYLKTYTSSANRTNTPIQEVPQSIQVITSQLISDQGATSYKEVVRNLAGVLANAPYQSYTLRGFSENSNFFVNGMRATNFLYFTQQPLLFNIESIENVKGPASALFGFGQPGGIINFITKKPQFTQQQHYQLSYGRWNTITAVADLTGRIGKQSAGRVIGAYEQTDGFRSPRKGNNVQVASSLYYEFSPKTNLLFDAAFQHYKMGNGYDPGTMAIRRADNTFDLYQVPASFTASNPDIDRTLNSSYTAGVHLKHRFRDALSLNSQFRTSASYTKHRGHEQDFGYSVFGALQDSVYRFFANYAYQNRDYWLNNYLIWNLPQGKTTHQILAGVDFGYSVNREKWYESYSAPPIHIFHPDFSKDDYQNYKDTSYYEYSRKRFATLAAYIQDEIKFSKKLLGLLSLRFDHYTFLAKPLDAVVQNAPADTTRANALLPKVGLVFMPSGSLSFYLSYCQSYRPFNSNYTNRGGPFDPERGKQWESGVKLSLLGDKLLTTWAIYQIEKDNMLFKDPDRPNRFIQSGKARSRGTEVSVQGQISTNLGVSANYAFTDARFTENSDAGVKGGRLNAAPKHLANGWVKYQFNKGSLKGLFLGGGFQFVDERLAINSKSFQVPGYTIYDAIIGYKGYNYNITLNGFNLGDRRYFEGAQRAVALMPGAPFSFRMTFQYYVR